MAGHSESKYKEKPELNMHQILSHIFEKFCECKFSCEVIFQFAHFMETFIQNYSRTSHWSDIVSDVKKIYNEQLSITDCKNIIDTMCNLVYRDIYGRIEDTIEQISVNRIKEQMIILPKMLLLAPIDFTTGKFSKTIEDIVNSFFTDGLGDLDALNTTFPALRNTSLQTYVTGSGPTLALHELTLHVTIELNDSDDD